MKSLLLGLSTALIASSVMAAECSQSVVDKIESACKINLNRAATYSILNSATCGELKGNGQRIEAILSANGEELLTVDLNNCASDVKSTKRYSLRPEGGASDFRIIYQKLFYATANGNVNFMDANRDFYDLKTTSGNSYKNAQGISYEDKLLTIEGTNAQLSSEKFNAREKTELRKRAIAIGLKAFDESMEEDNYTPPSRPQRPVKGYWINKVIYNAADNFISYETQTKILNAGMKATQSSEMQAGVRLCDKTTSYYLSNAECLKNYLSDSSKIYFNEADTKYIISEMCTKATETYIGEVECIEGAIAGAGDDFMKTAKNHCPNYLLPQDQSTCYREFLK